MAKWDFYVDSDKQRELSDDLGEYASNFDEKRVALYNEIDNMENDWTGEDYKAFQDGTHNYEPALIDLSNSMRMFSEHFLKISSATYYLAQDIINVIADAADFGTVSHTVVYGPNKVDLTTMPKREINANEATIEMPNQENEKHSDFVEFFGANNYWKTVGDDFANNFDFSNDHNIFDYVITASTGGTRTILDVTQLAGNVVFDGVNDALEGIEWLLWDNKKYDTLPEDITSNEYYNPNDPFNNGYWNNLGENFKENFDHTNDETFMDYVYTTSNGYLKSIWDGVGVAGHFVVDTGQAFVVGVESVWNMIFSG